MIYIMDMESSLAAAVAQRIVGMGQYFVYRKWDMAINVAAELAAYQDVLRGIIITGSARNINGKKSPPPGLDPAFFEAGVPVLGICYGLQLMAHIAGVPIIRCWNEQDPQKRIIKGAKRDKGEQGRTQFFRTAEESLLFRGLGTDFPIWMKHSWMASQLPEGWTLTGSTARCPVAAMEREHFFAVQFHPELQHSLFGRTIIDNWLKLACGLNTPYF
jgi:GMP synthase (glutamine-hydrolysing)